MEMMSWIEKKTCEDVLRIVQKKRKVNGCD